MGRSPTFLRGRPPRWAIIRHSCGSTAITLCYVNQWQRQIPSAEAVAYFDGQTPVHVVRFGGLELTRIMICATVCCRRLSILARRAQPILAGQIRLAAYKLDQQMANPGDRFQTTFYLQSRAPMTVNYNVLVRLVGQDGAEIWRVKKAGPGAHRPQIGRCVKFARMVTLSPFRLMPSRGCINFWSPFTIQTRSLICH